MHFSRADFFFVQAKTVAQRVGKDLTKYEQQPDKRRMGIYYAKKWPLLFSSHSSLADAMGKHTMCDCMCVCTICIRWPFLQMSLIGHSVTLHRIDHMRLRKFHSFISWNACMHKKKRKKKRKPLDSVLKNLTNNFTAVTNGHYKHAFLTIVAQNALIMSL